MRVIGIMSGSSLDGLDVVSVLFSDDHSYVIEHAETMAMPLNITDQLSKSSSLNIVDYLILESTYTKFIAVAISSFKVNNNITQIDLISIHGHTVSHNPAAGYSQQMVNAGWLAASLSDDVLSDFRNQDIGKNGQGAPLAPIVEKLFTEYFAFCNLGGIANVSFHAPEKIIAYDVSPCNQIFNFFALKKGKQYDENGEIGRKGSVNQQLKRKWQSLPYFNTSGAKSMDNDWIKTQFLNENSTLSIEDQQATAYEFVAEQIASSFCNELNENDRVLMTGGGSHNKYLIELIQKFSAPKNIKIIIPEKDIVDFKECLLMAYLGFLYKKGIHSTIPASTNSTEAVFAGAYYRGK